MLAFVQSWSRFITLFPWWVKEYTDYVAGKDKWNKLYTWLIKEISGK